MAQTVFFSWQTDTPTLTGRNFIERALERALARIAKDTELAEADRKLEVDRDTKGEPGTPPIVETIFNKIDGASVFVPDLTFVGTRLDGRPSPNPNVLIEYGWAVKALGYRRMVPVMNVAYGEPKPELMPFDLRHLKNPIAYCCPDRASEEQRQAARQSLSRSFEMAIRTILEREPALVGPHSITNTDQALSASHDRFLETFNLLSSADAKSKNFVGWRADVQTPPRYGLHVCAIPKRAISVPEIASDRRYRITLEPVAINEGNIGFPGFPELADFRPEIRAWGAKRSLQGQVVEQLIRSDGLISTTLMQWFPAQQQGEVPVEWLLTLFFSTIFVVERFKRAAAETRTPYEYQFTSIMAGDIDMLNLHGKIQPGVLRFSAGGLKFPKISIAEQSEIPAAVRTFQLDLWSALGRQIAPPIEELTVNLPLMMDSIEGSTPRVGGK